MATNDDHNENTPPRRTRRRQSTLGELWDFLRVRKKFWLLPIIISLVLLGALIWLGTGAGVISPFVYML